MAVRLQLRQVQTNNRKVWRAGQLRSSAREKLRNCFVRGSYKTALPVNFRIVIFVFCAVILCKRVALAADTTAPQFVSIDFAPKSIDVTNSAQTVTVTAQITDDSSGFDNGHLIFHSPSGKQNAQASLFSSSRISGTANDGIYQVSISIPKQAEAGTWKLDLG